ncbi:hypothetical protein [Archangium lansingense]|uniref:Uncharacterized protein n=1 Tax=Archangium lansingense TaxID=2995310 RepID=A0ABT4A9J2_9BACT|nr:hypothetical protein [Archangium lansinium]MCY1078316.1 hypothetical protein [Archangium lansinium]
MQFFQLSTLGDMKNPELALTWGTPEGMEMRGYTLGRGKPATPHYPKRARVSLREDHAGIQLSSLLGNADNYLVVHKDVKQVIAEHCQGVEVEYLPFDLYDHRKRLYSRDYLFINPIGTRDCLEPVASGVEIGPEGGVIHVAQCVLDPKKAEALPALFRPVEKPAAYIVSQPLAEALRARGFTNIIFTPLTFSAAT